MSHIKPLPKALSLDTYANERPVVFSWFKDGSSGGDAVEVCIPLSIAYRIYYFARAFDGQVAKRIEPVGMARVEFIELQRLIDELEIVEATTTDPVSQYYLSKLLPLLRTSRGHPKSYLNVVLK